VEEIYVLNRIGARVTKKFLRNVVVGAISSQPPSVKRWLVRHPRLLLGVLFRLERDDIVISPAGPRGCRFQMKLSWQGHTTYVIGAYENEFIDVMRRYLRSGDTCVDVGGHLGYYCLLMARIVGPKGRVISFEPVQENMAVLKENVALNRITNIELVNCALGERPGTLSLIRPKNFSLSWTPSVRGYSVEGARDSVEVEVDTLDAFLSRGGHKPSVIKIDVEGAELDVLRGANETLRTARPVVLLEIHGWGDAISAEILALFSSAGYTVSVAGTRGHEAFCLALPNPAVNSRSNAV
jgi:FkbM family methyltransferase